MTILTAALALWKPAAALAVITVTARVIVAWQDDRRRTRAAAMKAHPSSPERQARAEADRAGLHERELTVADVLRGDR